jgi:tellurite resistance protein TerC
MLSCPAVHESIGSPALLAAFIGAVLALLAIDLGLVHRKAHTVSAREALGWTAVWVSLSLAFNGWIYVAHGPQPGLEFLTGYVIEYALSVDNIFVFLVIFSYFAVPADYQHRVLFWGILGAILLRALFVVAGAALLAQFHWVIFLFGGFLVLTGWKLLGHSEPEVDPERNPLVRLFRRVFPITAGYRGQQFLVREGGRLLATPLLLVLVVVEATDVVFAVDSIPAIFAITRDPFIVFTSNICAVLGLRSLYFLLASAMGKFHYLGTGLGVVLMFVGVKMLLSELYPIPIQASLGVVVGVLTLAILASWLFPPRPKAAA